MEIVKNYAGAGLGIGLGGVKAKVEAGIDVVNSKTKLSKNQEINWNLGVNVDTGFEAGVDGVTASVGGFGFKLGRNTGISTPFGGISVKLF